MVIFQFAMSNYQRVDYREETIFWAKIIRLAKLVRITSPILLVLLNVYDTYNL